jgi:TPR repeat protein
LAKSNEEIEQNTLERVKANDPVALYVMGASCHREGNYERAFEYWTKAVASGDIEAHYALSVVYDYGQGVEMDEIKQVYHLEKAAIGGHPQARYHLGCIDGRNGRYRRAMKHFIIASNLGYDDALEEIKMYFSGGIVNEEDYPSALCGHQAAVDATKSAPRDEAEKARREGLF